MKTKFKLLMLFTICIASLSFAKNTTIENLKGEWKGAYIMNAHVVKFNVYIQNYNGSYKATIDIPSQNKYNEVYDVKINNREFYLSKLNKEGILIEYKGAIEGKNIIGSFHFNSEYMKGKPGMFQLMKSNAKFIKGEQLPDFKLTTLNNNEVTNSDYKGKYFFLDFWATWCLPCVAKRPKLETIKKELGDKINILSVSLDNTTEIVSKFREAKFPIQWSHVLKVEKMKDPFVKSVVPS